MYSAFPLAGAGGAFVRISSITLWVIRMLAVDGEELAVAQRRGHLPKSRASEAGTKARADSRYWVID